MLLAEGGESLVGTAVASFDGWRAYIYHVAVAEEHRRSGVGYDLMAQAEQFLTSAGARYVHVVMQQENTEGSCPGVVHRLPPRGRDRPYEAPRRAPIGDYLVIGVDPNVTHYPTTKRFAANPATPRRRAC